MLIWNSPLLSMTCWFALWHHNIFQFDITSLLIDMWPQWKKKQQQQQTLSTSIYTHIYFVRVMDVIMALTTHKKVLNGYLSELIKKPCNTDGDSVQSFSRVWYIYGACEIERPDGSPGNYINLCLYIRYPLTVAHWDKG